MFKQVRLHDAILKFYQRSQPIAFSNAETLYDDLVLLRDQILMYGDLSEAQTNYLNNFIEKFDTSLSASVRGIFEKWLSDGFLVDLIRGVINEEVVEARDGEGRLNLRLIRDKQNTDTEINLLKEKDDQLAMQLTRMKTQTEQLSIFYKKLMSKHDVTAVMQGDSMTYGQDNSSANSRTPDTIPADDGSAHIQNRAETTIPESLQNYLRRVYGNNSTVINKGYSGDWAERSYNRWTNNSNADVALVMLGTNDSSVSSEWIPESVRGELQKYIVDIRRIIDRYLGWGTPVILLTPPRLKAPESPSSGYNTEPYRTALYSLGDEYGIPVVDTEEFLNGCDETYYSDGVHLNSKGYEYFASRLTGVFVGYGIKNPVRLKSGDTLSIRTTRDNFVSNGVVINQSITSRGPEEGIDGSGLYISVSPSKSVQYGFETLEDNLVLIPMYLIEIGSVAKTVLDFGNEQGSVPLRVSVYSDESPGVKPPSSISSTIGTLEGSSVDMFKSGEINVRTPDLFMHITNQGWHTLSFENSGTEGTVYLNGFIVMSYEDFFQRGKSEQKDHIVIHTHDSYSSTDEVTETSLNIDDLLSSINLTKEPLYYWKNVPLQITVVNSDNTIESYAIQLGQETSTNTWLLDKTPIVRKLVETPNESEIRKLSNISYIKETKTLKLIWTGATTKPTTIVISRL